MQKFKKIEGIIIIIKIIIKIIIIIIKDVPNLSKLKKKDFTTSKDIRNLFRLKKENESIKDRVIRDTRHLLEHEVEAYYKPIRVGNFCSNSYTKYENNGDRKKNIVNWRISLIRLDQN